jgi:hypothetical protein
MLGEFCGALYISSKLIEPKRDIKSSLEQEKRFDKER